MCRSGELGARSGRWPSRHCGRPMSQARRNAVLRPGRPVCGLHVAEQRNASQEDDMSGLGGLNKAPDGVVIGLVQLQNPVVVTAEDLARQTDRIVELVGKARRNLPTM